MTVTRKGCQDKPKYKVESQKNQIMSGNIGEWEGFIEEHKLEELYIFDDDEEVSHFFF